MNQPAPGKNAPAVALALAALGVVFGDIGTSPLYALRECFRGAHSLPLGEGNVLGAVSLILWFLIIIVAIKYAVFVMQADNKGEGGILALMALVQRLTRPPEKKAAWLIFFSILGAALLFSDGVITPAISVLSAVEGLQDFTPMFSPYIIPFSIFILALLFLVQSRGTGKIGSWFGPVISLWFLTMGVLGAVSLCRNPHILLAINPLHAVRLLLHNGFRGFTLLGTAFLAVTGAEVLYTDLGHFGKRPIRQAWFILVLPCLILNYLGQGAALLGLSQPPAHLFYSLAPDWFVMPLVVLATLATIIASQAVISGAFSLARQAVQLGLGPRLTIIHTSEFNIGQVYVPFINATLFVVTLFLILFFRSSGALAAAYGIAVSATMLITTIFILLIAPRLWPLPRLVLWPVIFCFLVLHALLFFANLAKVFSGGWVVVVLCLGVCLVMTTWVKGRQLLQRQSLDETIPLRQFVQDVTSHPVSRIEKTGVFLSGNPDSVPRSLLHNFKHNGVLHSQTVIATVLTAETPYVPEAERCAVTSFENGFYLIIFRYGFMENPNLIQAFKQTPVPELQKDPVVFSYFLGKESLRLSRSRVMSRWRKELFAFLSRNSLSASAFFRLPANAVVELGQMRSL